jgi:hypothetical protein
MDSTGSTVAAGGGAVRGTAGTVSTADAGDVFAGSLAVSREAGGARSVSIIVVIVVILFVVGLFVAVLYLEVGAPIRIRHCWGPVSR